MKKVSREKLLATLRSEASQANDDEAHERLGKWAKENPRLLFRVGRLGIHYVVGTAPHLVTEILNIPYTRRGIEVVGAGAHSTVLYDERHEEVKKIVRSSEGMSTSSREQYAAQLRQGIQGNTDTHHEVIVSTDVIIEKHPISGNDVIVLRQPFLVPDSDEPSTIAEQLRAFGEKSLDEQLPNGLLPDVVDPANMIVVDGEIRLLDTVPLHKATTYPRVFETAQHILSIMSSHGRRTLVDKHHQ